MSVTWKKIKNFENYEVSNTGMVRKVTTKRVHKGQMSRGYKSVALRDNVKRHRKMVHRLVAEAFIPNPKNKTVVNHLDRNRANNLVENLEWCTPIENINHAFGRDKRYGVYKTKLPNAKYVSEIRYCTKLIPLGFFKNKEKAYKMFYECYYILHGFYPWKKELNIM